MRIVKLTLFYLSIMVLSMVLSLAGVRMSFALGIFGFIVGIIIFIHLHKLYFTKNMKIVDKFVIERKKQPFFAHVYANAYGTKEEELQALDVLIQKYKQPTVKYNYMFIKGIIEKNLTVAKNAAEQIDKEPIKSYAYCYIAALEGRIDDMRSKQLGKAWMQPAIEAIYAHEQGSGAEFQEQVEKSIGLARGVQKYILIHSFEKMKREL